MTVSRSSSGSVSCEGNVGIILAPLLCAAASAGSLKSEYRTIEDKLEHASLAWRPGPHRPGLRVCPVPLPGNATSAWTLIASVHGNREMPAFYDMWLVVHDAHLPAKGTAHRAVIEREGEKPADAAALNPQLALYWLCSGTWHGK